MGLFIGYTNDRRVIVQKRTIHLFLLWKKMTLQKRGIFAFLTMIATPLISNAETFRVIESFPVSELWINPGFYSYHFQKDKGLNNSNFGFGAEYRYSTVNSITAGVFYNSDRQTSHYAGWYWQPFAVGPMRFGVTAGVLDGYPRMQNGGWFPSIIPTASVEFNSVGANIIFVPSYKDKVYGSISLQLKIRVY